MSYRAPLFGVLAALVLAVAFYFLLYQPRSEEQAQLEQETAQLESQAAQLQTEIARLKEIEANLPEIQAALSRVEEYIPAGVAQPSALRQFQLAADAAGVEITAVTFGEPTPIEGAPPSGDPDLVLADIPLSMTVEGGYFQLVDLLRRLEVDVPRAVLVETLEIAEAEAGFPTLATTWTGRLFALVRAPVEPAPAAPATPGPDGTPNATPAPTPTEGAEPQ